MTAGKAPRGDLSYALKLLASGQGVGEVWRETGFESRKALANRLFELAESSVPTQHLSVVAYSDGASRGNPGDAGCGVVILDESGRVLLEEHKYLGRTTNNVAEYQAAILALEKASELGATRLELRVDSSLLANQIKGRYKVKSEVLAGFYQSLMEKVKLFDTFEVTLIRRTENTQADRLASLGVSARKGG
ncbi:MAG: ribonuclease HI family protein [Candidatus Eisenbacteria bacterium]